MAARRNWTEEEVRQALALYLLTDFGRLHSKNADIRRLAEKLGRTAGAVAMKACNLAALDETLPRKGMSNVSRIDRKVWNEYLHDPSYILNTFKEQYQNIVIPQDSNLLYERGGMKDEAGASLLPTERQAMNLPEAAENGAPDAIWPEKRGENRVVLSSRRLGQEFFRRMILTSYKSRCALTGIEDARLLIASHIVGWEENATLRLNPSNGICLNALHDKAFDRHLITFDEDYRIVIADDVPQRARHALNRERGVWSCRNAFCRHRNFWNTTASVFISGRSMPETVPPLTPHPRRCARAPCPG